MSAKTADKLAADEAVLRECVTEVWRTARYNGNHSKITLAEKGYAALAELVSRLQAAEEDAARWHETQTPEFIDYWFKIGRSCSAGEAITELLARVATLTTALEEIKHIEQYGTHPCGACDWDSGPYTLFCEEHHPISIACRALADTNT